MTNDLSSINRLLAEHWLGTLSREQEEYVRHASVCLAQLPHSTKTLRRRLERFRRTQPRASQVVQINRQYLCFARMAAKDALSHRPDMLIRLGMTFEQACFLRDLADEDLECLALAWQRPISRFPHRAFKRGARLHRQASRLHAASFVAARPDEPGEMDK